MDKNDSNNINYLFSQIDKTINAFREGASIDFSSVATYLHNDLCELGELLDQKNYKDLFKKCEAIKKFVLNEVNYYQNTLNLLK